MRQALAAVARLLRLNLGFERALLGFELVDSPCLRIVHSLAVHSFDLRHNQLEVCAERRALLCKVLLLRLRGEQGLRHRRAAGLGLLEWRTRLLELITEIVGKHHQLLVLTRACCDLLLERLELLLLRLHLSLRCSKVALKLGDLILVLLHLIACMV